LKLASVQAKLKDTAAAKASLNTALELKPDYLEAATALAWLEVQAGRYVEALKLAQQIQRQTPQSPGGFSLEGGILTAQAKYAAAARANEKAYALSKNGLLAIKVHQSWALAGDIKKADTGLLQWLKEQPNDLGARAYLAKAYEKAGKNKLAIDQYELILQKDGNNLFALNNLAWLYQQNKDPRALKYAEQAYKLDPNNAAVVDTLGWILTNQGQLTRSLALQEKAMAQDPQVPEARYHYAVALAKSGDKAKARKQLEQALAMGKHFSQIEQARVLYNSLQ
jgi:putative PEP-CTERM system TPR-repeat lipoprotein